MDPSENKARNLTNELRALRQRSRPDHTIVPSERQATRSPEIIELIPADDRHPQRTGGLIGFGLLLVVLAWVLVSPPIFTRQPQSEAIVPPKAEIVPPSIPVAPPPIALEPVALPPTVISAPVSAPAPKEETITLHKAVPVRAARGKVLEDDGSDSFRIVDPPAPVAP